MSKTPLRQAVERWVRSHHRWERDAMLRALFFASRHSGVTERGAQIYVCNLVATGVLEVVEQRMTTGPEIAWWLSHEPRTKVGGNSRLYRRRQERYHSTPMERREQFA